MTQPKIIGLCGPAGSGKDTVASILCQHEGYAPVSFADPIRVMLSDLLIMRGVSAGDANRYMQDRKYKEQPIPGIGVSYRHLAQTLGTEWGRGISPTLWLDIMGARLAGRETPVVISDVRFPNEAEWIKAQPGAELWRIERPGVAAVRPHVSEAMAGLLTADRVIHNTGTLEDLAQAVNTAMQEPGV